MQAHRSPLLLLVQANVEPAHEQAFNSWYYHHVPKLLEIPGYLWGRRYLSLVGDTRYLALYRIQDASYLESVLGEDPVRRDHRANREREQFDALMGLSDVRTNVYEQLSGSHLGGALLERELPLSVVMADCVVAEKEEEFNRWYDHSHVPNLVQIDGYVSGARFRVLDDPAVRWRNTGPKYLALYELANLDCVARLTDPERMSPQASAELDRWAGYGAPLVDNLSWHVYRPIATHHPLAS